MPQPDSRLLEKPDSLASSGRLSRLLAALRTTVEQLSRAGPKRCGREAWLRSPILWLRATQDEPTGLLVASSVCLLLTGSLGCFCTCRTESGLCSLPRFLLFAFWPTFTSLWLAIAGLSVSVDLQNPVILGFTRQWSVLSRDSWDGNPNNATSIDGIKLQAYPTSDPVLDYAADWEAIVAGANNVFASVELTLSDRSSSFRFLTPSSEKADYLVQIKGSALGKYDGSPSQSSFYDVA